MTTGTGGVSRTVRIEPGGDDTTRRRPARVATIAWQHLRGNNCVATFAWKLRGNICVATIAWATFSTAWQHVAWQHLRGNICVATFAWQHLRGTFAWQHLRGNICVATRRRHDDGVKTFFRRTTLAILTPILTPILRRKSKCVIFRYKMWRKCDCE